MENKSPIDAAFSLAKDLKFDKATMRELKAFAFPYVKVLAPKNKIKKAKIKV